MEKAHKSGLLHRLAPGEKPGLARMATVAAVYTIKPNIRGATDILGEGPKESRTARPRPEHKRVWASDAVQEWVSCLNGAVA